jgi:hypothetical protein
MNGLHSFILDNLTHDSEGIELVFIAYANDIAVAVSSDPKNGRGMLVIRKVVELVDRWLEENGFEMSTTKTKIVHFCRKHRCQNPDIRLRGIAIQVVNIAKFLGVTRKINRKKRSEQNENSRPHKTGKQPRCHTQDSQ